MSPMFLLLLLRELCRINFCLSALLHNCVFLKFKYSVVLKQIHDVLCKSMVFIGAFPVLGEPQNRKHVAYSLACDVGVSRGGIH